MQNAGFQRPRIFNVGVTAGIGSVLLAVALLFAFALGPVAGLLISP
jgi:hypothetical protein